MWHPAPNAFGNVVTFGGSEAETCNSALTSAPPYEAPEVNYTKFFNFVSQPGAVISDLHITFSGANLIGFDKVLEFARRMGTDFFSLPFAPL